MLSSFAVLSGQLAAIGFPIVGDNLYGGCTKQDGDVKGLSGGFVSSEDLALQAHRLELNLPQILQANVVEIPECWWHELVCYPPAG